jgi:pimeloyl-ACP methyl ester carboxylesterase
MKRIIFLAILLLNTVYASGETYTVEEVEFTSHEDKLSGSIVFPENSKVHSAVVFVHGSGEQTRNLHWAKRFASKGIAALVYDKRGVGLSGGKYESQQSVSEKNIALLADDAHAALEILSKHKKTKELPLGLTGISQAGWIVPLVAEKSNNVNFMVLWSSPVCKVSEEDIFSKYTADLDGTKIPSYTEALNSRKRKYIWPDFLGNDTDPSASLAKLKIPGLWIFGANDGSIPVDLSIRRLQTKIDSGHDYEYVLFSGLGHNNMTETFSTSTDWIKRLPR